MDIKTYFENILTFNGPILSMVQAAIGMFVSIIIVKSVSVKINRGSKYKINLVLLIIVSIIIGIITVLGGALGLFMDLPPYIYYPIPLLISLVMPKIIFKLNWFEFILYILIGILVGLISHVLFSLFIGYNNYMPFWKIK
jgi:H+/Cl- antiporter ClcA